MHTLNLGILAHVDAGKTSLTERILFETGVITDIGRVDHGTTQTDTLELERQRGITIQSAVASFQLDDLAVNLIDTPGHSDFIAEVGRALQVLDAVIVVISAVEGVQSQTRRLVQAIRTSGIPLLLFINKIDRAGAQSDDLVAEIARGLKLCPLVFSRVSEIGTRAASVHLHDFDDPAVAEQVLDVLAEHNDDVIARYLLTDACPSRKGLRRELARQIRDQKVMPVFFGSAITGAGVDHLLHELPRLLGTIRDRPGDDLSGVVFKIQRTSSGEKVGLVRLFSGRLAVREHVTVRSGSDNGEADRYSARITGIELYRPGALQKVSEARSGDIVRLHGIPELRIGDVIGQVLPRTPIARFPPPTLESVIRPEDPADTTRMYAALEQLEDQDPLISIRRGTRDSTISLRLYGEVQKEVIEATLLADYGIPVQFEPSQTICMERVVGAGSAGEEMGGANPFAAAVAFEIEPGAPDGGIHYHRELGSLPLAFYRAIEETVRQTLREGLLGWEVRDCVIRLTRVAYSSPVSTAADFRNLTPLVLMQALRRAGTEVCEPVERFVLDVPLDAVGDAYGLLASVRAVPDEAALRRETSRITGTIPSSETHRFEQHLPALGRGEAVFMSSHAEYQPVRGTPPERARTDFNPLNRKLYLALVSQS